jgi:hypothetical protein
MYDVLQALIAEVNALRTKIDEIAQGREVDRRASSGTPMYPGLTPGRVLFAGADKELDDDSVLFWDDTNKRLGIGTSSPSAKLDVTDGYIRALAGTNNAPASGTGVELVYTGTAGFIVSYDRSAAEYKQLNINGAPLVLNAAAGTGKVGIGTGAPDLELDVQSAEATTYTGIEITNTASSTRRWAIASNSNTTTFGPAKGFFIRDVSGGATLLSINTTGYVRIGDTSSASYRLELPNTASAAGQGRANAWVTYSSRTFKKGIKEPERGEHRSRIRRLRAVEYELDETLGGGKDVSLIAEEVAEVFPELVTGDTPETLGLKLDRIGVVLLPIVQELMETIEVQQEEISTLQEQVKAQREMMHAFEARLAALERRR